jgi:protein phosphatase/serine/threonine-protein phosphatase Stp1
MSGTEIAFERTAAGRFVCSAATHVGTVRDHNEDRAVYRPDLGLWAVADGAGGHQSGEVAARQVAEALQSVPAGLSAPQLLSQVRLRLASAHQALREEAARRGPDAILASTVVVLLAHGDHFACLWAGDSRAYLLREGQFSLLTRDHSLVQGLVDAGAISAEEAAAHPRSNIITRAAGAGGEVLELDKVTGRLGPGDLFLLCSDGLSKCVPNAEMAAALSRDGGAAAECLVAAALEHAATDNVTAVTVAMML